MRLLNTSKIMLCEFSGEDIPKYAILSHRWETEEVSFQDLQEGRGFSMKGFTKISGCCAQARADGYLYAWVDSCCIDKTSSAELSEALNSMFRWYQNAHVCYVYLSDVPTGLDWHTHSELGSRFRSSKWWKRGWTLQELIAPRSVMIYDSDWKEIGTRVSLEILISSITGISRSHLRDYSGASVAQKMSWASKRKTTRIEDQAYSLMGLFSVHMPPLYGEGSKAFQRLQLEILASSDDESIFAWYNSSLWYDSKGLLADRPEDFSDSGDIVRASIDKDRPPFSMTNKGLRIELFLFPSERENIFYAPLNCVRQNSGDPVALYLDRTPNQTPGLFKNTDEFRREDYLGNVPKRDRGPMPPNRTVLFIKQIPGAAVQDSHYGHYCRKLQFAINLDSTIEERFSLQVGWGDASLDGPPTKQVYEYQNNFRHRKFILTPRTLGTRQNEISADARRQAEQNGESALYIEDYTKSSFVWLKFSKKTFSGFPNSPRRREDSFIIILEAEKSEEHSEDFRPTPTINLLTPRENQQLEHDLRQLMDFGPNWMRRLDRISKTMNSGASVSVALRKSGAEKGLYKLDITTNPYGKLPWPDLATMGSFQPSVYV